MTIRWDKTGSVWHTDVGKVGRYSVRRTRPRGPYAAFLNNERIMSESVHSDAEVVKRYVETRIETAARINAEPRKVQVGTVDMTPTWGEMLPVLTNALANGSHEQQDIARQELTKMATAADTYNAMQRELNKRIALGKVALMELGGGNG